MTDALIARLDRFAIRLLDDADAGCDDPQANDTSTTEDDPGKPAVSLTERVSVFRAVSAYLEKRGERDGDGSEAKPDQAEPGEPTIVSMERRLKGRRHR